MRAIRHDNLYLFTVGYLGKCRVKLYRHAQNKACVGNVDIAVKVHITVYKFRFVLNDFKLYRMTQRRTCIADSNRAVAVNVAEKAILIVKAAYYGSDGIVNFQPVFRQNFFCADLSFSESFKNCICKVNSHFYEAECEACIFVNRIKHLQKVIERSGKFIRNLR